MWWHRSICNLFFHASPRPIFLLTRLATLHPNQLSTGSPTFWDLLTSRRVTKERNRYIHNYRCRSNSAYLSGLGKLVLSRICILLQTSLVFQNSGHASYIQIMINLLNQIIKHTLRTFSILIRPLVKAYTFYSIYDGCYSLIRSNLETPTHLKT